MKLPLSATLTTLPAASFKVTVRLVRAMALPSLPTKLSLPVRKSVLASASVSSGRRARMPEVLGALKPGFVPAA